MNHKKADKSHGVFTAVEYREFRARVQKAVLHSKRDMTPAEIGIIAARIEAAMTK